jgi:hypothetical protein
MWCHALWQKFPAFFWNSKFYKAMWSFMPLDSHLHLNLTCFVLKCKVWGSQHYFWEVIATGLWHSFSSILSDCSAVIFRGRSSGTFWSLKMKAQCLYCLKPLTQWHSVTFQRMWTFSCLYLKFLTALDLVYGRKLSEATIIASWNKKQNEAGPMTTDTCRASQS